MTSLITSSLNSVERREWMIDNGSSGTGNFAIISRYKGYISTEIIKSSLMQLAQAHPYLRTTIKVINQEPKFQELTQKISIPLNEHTYLERENQWKKIVKDDLRYRFNDDKKPLWRVSFLKGDQEGQIIFTFHHSIADAVSGAELINHLLKMISATLKQETCSLAFNSTLPPLESLYPLIKNEPKNQEPKAEETDAVLAVQVNKFQTDFAMHCIDESLTLKVIEASRLHHIKLNGMLFAAFLKAIVNLYQPSFKQFFTVTSVNFRQYFNPPVSKELLRPLFGYILDNFEAGNETNFIDLAKLMDRTLHDKLKEGAHILNLKQTAQQLEKKLTPQEFLGSKVPSNVVCITNIGALNFNGTYSSKELTMEDIFFVTNIESHFEHKENSVLAVVTFQNRIYLTLSFLEGLSSQKEGQAILKEIESILKEACK